MAVVDPAVGVEAPDFSLPDQSGQVASLRSWRGRKSIILFFYPRDYTPICTIENIAFKAAYPDLEAAGAEVLGISSDKPGTHAAFCDLLKLPFRLLTDQGNTVRERYNGLRNVTGAGRVTYVIDKAGIIRHVYEGALRPKKHVTTALQAAQELT